MPTDHFLGSCLLDSCIFIDYFRTKEKSKTLYLRLVLQYDRLCISSVVLFEVLCGVKDSHMDFWEDCLKTMTVLSFDKPTAELAADLSIRLRKNRIQLESSDLFIAATALANDLPLATLNRKHFERIDDLKLVDDKRNLI